MMTTMPYFIPFGFVFAPSDEQLVKHYLLKAITGEPTGPFTIPKADVYGCDPCTLDWSDKNLKNMLRPNELYFFVDRDKISDKPASKRPRRTLKAKTHGGDCGCGYWNSNAADREILDESTGTIIGTKRTLTFFRGKRQEGKKQKTDYIMHEYLLCSGGKGANQHDDFQKLALCRIKFNAKKNTTSTAPPFGMPSSSPLQVIDEEEYDFASGLEDYHEEQTPFDPNNPLLASWDADAVNVHDEPDLMNYVHDHEEQSTYDPNALLASWDADAVNVVDEADLMNYAHELEASLEQAPVY